MANLEDLIVKPGPVTGSQRPVGAPNAGALGGRPPSPGGSTTSSPMERLASEIPVVQPPTPGILPAPGQPAQPTPGGAPPIAAPPSPAATPGITINVGQPQQGASAQPTPSNVSGEMWPDAQAPVPQPTAPTPPIEFKRQPFADELAQVPDGSVVRTPWGEGRVAGGAVRDYNLTPAGKEAHGRATIRAVERFGAHPWSNDSGAPPPPVEPGKLAFNPFLGEGKGWS